MSRFSIIDEVERITGASDGDLAVVMDIARSTVQAYRAGRRNENNLTKAQRELLLDYARRFRDAIVKDVFKLELMM